jgi:CubicO group peptidase (beta-lactamase class C family)
VNYLILQLLVEEVSGLPFAEYMRQAVFAPLGMTRTTYFLGDQQDAAASRSATSEVVPFRRYAAAGATGLATTVNDLLRFIDAQLPRGQGGPLWAAGVRAMRAPEPCSAVGPGSHALHANPRP